MNSYLRTKYKKQKHNQKKARTIKTASDVDEPCEETVHTTNDEQEPDKAALMVYWTPLLVLL